MQFSGFDEKRKLAVGQPGGDAVRRTSGLDLLSNDNVNLCASAITAAAGVALCTRFQVFG